MSDQVDPLGVFISALRDYLTAQLPGAVTTVNATRAAVLLSPPGPFTVGAGASIRLDVSREGAGTRVTLPTGSVTAAQVATAINSAAPSGLTASSDTAGRLVVTATATPTTSAPSVAVLLTDDDGLGVVTGGNVALGWAEGGEYAQTSALRAPTWRGVCDGWPTAVPDMGQGFWLVLGDRVARPVGESSLRRDSWAVTVKCYLLKPDFGGAPHRSREGVTAALRAVKEALLSTDGRQLGRSSVNDVQRVEVMEETVQARGVAFQQQPSFVHDTATLTITGRVFQRPANSG